MAEWRETTLGEVCDEVGGIIQTGPFGSQLHESDYSSEGTPVVMPKDIIEGRIATDSVARVSSEHVERLSRHKLRSGDIVYGRRGDIGRQALIRQKQEGWICGTGCLRLSFGESVLNPLFLHYYLRQDDVVSWITNQAVGATMPNLNTGILRTVPVRFPPLPVQRRIAGILSAYDELIENNQRRIRILEEMARALYREWFVHFRFPGNEKLPRVSTPLGDIPQGWEAKRLKAVCRSVQDGDWIETKDQGGDPPDISHILQGINELLDRSIGAEPFKIKDRDRALGSIDLSKIDFKALAKRFEKKRPTSSDLERLKAAVKAQLEQMVRLNRTRADYLEKFQALIDAYNNGSRNIDEIFGDLVALTKALTEEQGRHVRERLSEEELTVFDILTRPGPKLTTEERGEVKKVARQLLARLNNLLALDWRKRSAARAQVRLAIEDVLDEGLPGPYTKELYKTKCDALFEHVYESYLGDGKSVYSEAA